jgi:phosphoglycolate phosphatase
VPDPDLAKVQGVLFDLDGTLLDTLEDIGRSANEVLVALGIPAHPIASYRTFVGEGVGTLFRRALPPGRGDDEELLGRCVAGFREAYGRGWDVATRPYPGIPELLDGLQARGMSMAVLSNKPHAFTVKCVTKLLPRWRFLAVMGERDGVPRKPDPGEAIRLAGVLRAEPGRIAYLGDTATDITTALRAGMIPVGVGWGFRPAQELTCAGAVRVLDHPVELLKLLGLAA